MHTFVNSTVLGILLLALLLVLTLSAAYLYRRVKKLTTILRIKRTKYQKVFNASRDAIVIFRFSDFRITDANTAALQLYGYSFEEFKSLTVYDLSAEVEKTHAFLTKAVSDNFFPQICFRKHKRKNGEYFSAEIVIGTFQIEGEIFVTGGIRNISQSLKTVENLELARFSLDKAGDAVFWISQSGTIKYANEAACQSLQYSREELMAKTVFDFTPALTYSSWIDFWNQVKMNACLTYESKHQTSSGKIFPVEKTAKILNYQDKEHICIFSRDITERQMAQQDLAKYAKDLEVTQKELQFGNARLENLVTELKREKQRAEQATQVKSEFLANVSHELRTPLTAILGFAQILRDDLELPKNKQSIDVIMRNGNYLLQLLNDILDLSKIEAGKISLELQKCSPMEIIQDVISLMQVRSDAKGLHLILRNSNPIPNVIETDPLRFRQILINLISNAIKFTEVGSVEVVLEYIDNTQAQAGNLLKIKVTDTGIGIPKNYLENIYQPFCQFDNSSTRKFGGSGLGLAISKRFSNLLGGELVAESTEGKGSTFEVTIDCGDISTSTNFVSITSSSPSVKYVVDATTPQKDALKHLNVLLVEDGPDNQKLFKYYLEKAGANVQLAFNGQEAIDMVIGKDRQKPTTQFFDLILMDIQMPILDGYEATRILRKAGVETPIVALTAHAMIDEGKKFFEVGCDDFITKPIFEVAFINKLQVYLSRKKELRQKNVLPITKGGKVRGEAKKDVNVWQSDLDISADPVLKKLLHQFIETLPNKAKAINLAFQQHDVERVRLLAHQLVGASGGYGLKAVMQKAKQLEDTCRAGVQDAECNAALKALSDVCLSYRTATKEFIH